jgi:Pyruvate/2-oxoacid:ferredoxin oxidoreductase gamma subunit
MHNILIQGTGGQGVKTLAITLAKNLESQGFNISIMVEYDSYVRGGKSDSLIVFSKKEILNPLVEEHDLVYDFTKEMVNKEQIEEDIKNLLKSKKKK